MEKSKCVGCHNDVYNYGLGGAKRCWNFKTAKIVWKKEVHKDQLPPWTQKAQRFPDCYKKQGYVYVSPKTMR